jgi:GNAT superfamily N-acetyltransferase
VIAPPYRRHGLARRLLDAACTGLRERGCTIAEAYPSRDLQSGSDADAYHGPLSMYLAAGFRPVRDTDRCTVVQKQLGGTVA